MKHSDAFILFLITGLHRSFGARCLLRELVPVISEHQPC